MQALDSPCILDGLTIKFLHPLVLTIDVPVIKPGLDYRYMLHHLFGGSVDVRTISLVLPYEQSSTFVDGSDLLLLKHVMFLESDQPAVTSQFPLQVLLPI